MIFFRQLLDLELVFRTGLNRLPVDRRIMAMDAAPQAFLHCPHSGEQGAMDEPQ